MYQVFMSNIKKENKRLIRQAAKETKARIRIYNTAFSKDLSLLPGYIAVYRLDDKSKDEFWQRYQELKSNA